MREILVEVVLASLVATSLAVAQSPMARQAPSSADSSSTISANAPCRNPSLPIAERVNDLISRMTLEEKVSQMRDHAFAIPRLGVPKYD
jgi:beta-glucosidase